MFAWEFENPDPQRKSARSGANHGQPPPFGAPGRPDPFDGGTGIWAIRRRRHPSAPWPPTWRACGTCGATCKTVREQQEHADIAEGRAEQEADQ